MNEKQLAYKDLMRVVDELKEKSYCWKTQTRPVPEINDEVLAFNEKICKLYYLKENKHGRKEIVSGWYEKHTKKQILVTLEYFESQLHALVKSEPYRATQGLAQFIEHDKSDKAYVVLLIEDITDKRHFKASMSKVRYASFRDEIRKRERPHIAVRTVIGEFDCRNEAMQNADCEF